MKRFTTTAVALTATAALLLTGCSGGGEASDGKTLNLYTWAGEIPDSVVADFQKETGIKVTLDTFDSNETMISKVAAGNSGYDLVMPSQSAVAQMVGQDLIQELDHSKMEGIENISEKFADPAYDPGLKYSMPWIWGTTGILYNRDCTGGDITSWDALWDPKYKGKIYMLDNMIGAYVAALQVQGLSITTTSEADITKATDKLLEQKPLLAGYNTTNYYDLVSAGDACVALAWGSRNTAEAIKANPAVNYIIPQGGGTIWVDGFAMPKDAKNTDAAYKFLSYLLKPEVAAVAANKDMSAVANGAATEFIEPEIAENPAIFPPQDTLKDAEFILDPTPILKYMQAGWTKVRAS